MKQLLKFLTCGSVDDGKSTLIGHMLYDAKLIFADQRQALELESQIGSAGGAVDYSLLLDGLQAEHEQGITIDVAYRYFSTCNRSFIVADAPGHEEYTRNMAVGASFADLAVILLDATKGILPQTKRHVRICSLCGIRDFVFAVNKMDLVGFDEAAFRNIEGAVQELLGQYLVHGVLVIPTSAVAGDNLTQTSVHTPWYTGSSLLGHLESVEVAHQSESESFCLPIQRVSRPDHAFRGFQGEVALGKILQGDRVRIMPSGEEVGVSRILVAGKDRLSAGCGDPVTLCLDREVDVSRGCVIERGSTCKAADRLACTMLWFDDSPLAMHRSYLLRLGTATVPAAVVSIRHGIDIETGQHVEVDTLRKNEIALVEIRANQPIVMDSFEHNPALGELILIDRVSHATAACGVVEYPLGTEGSPIAQGLGVTRETRERRNGHRALTVWFTGLSGSGKSTVADALERELFARGMQTIVLDGDNVRQGLNRDLGFSESDRSENIRRVAEASKLMNDAGVVVLASFISPFEADRAQARRILGDAYFEVYVCTPAATCEQRDVKGLYGRARRGEIKQFTGVNSPYEVPVNPDMAIDTTDASVQETVGVVLERIMKHLAID